MSLVARNVWMRGAAAPSSACQHRSISAGTARASPAIFTLRISAAIFFTASKAPSEAMGNPASMTSTCRRSSCRAIFSFSSTFMLKPGACSPSLNVVSKMMIRSICSPSFSVGPTVQIASVRRRFLRLRAIALALRRRPLYFLAGPPTPFRLMCGRFSLLIYPCIAKNSLQKNVLKSPYDLFARVRAGHLVPLIGPVEHSEQRISRQLRIHILHVILLCDAGNDAGGHPDILFFSPVNPRTVGARKRLALVQKSRHFEIALFEH